MLSMGFLAASSNKHKPYKACFMGFQGLRGLRDAGWGFETETLNFKGS